MAKNGYFQLEKRTDGAYLTVYPPLDGGLVCSVDMVLRYLESLKIDYDKLIVADLLKSASEQKTVRISSSLPVTADEECEVQIDPEYTTVTMRFFPEMPGGRKLSYDDVIRKLEKYSVKFGIDSDAINRYLSERSYCTDYIVAQAQMPVEGRDASIKYCFNTDTGTKPKLNEDGSVDFHQLNTLSVVEKDQVLAILTPSIAGEAGCDVIGRPIKPKKVIIKFLKQSKNTHISANGCELISNVNGHAVITDGQVFVYDIYSVPNNVDVSTGDIDYNGNVEIEGNVNAGYKVRATGDIVVNGIVEGAELYAGGQIILKRGIQGMGRGVLSAGSNIIAKFIESASVQAGGFIHTESIMHSQVVAGDEIVVKGKKGFITGGSIKSGKYIDAKIAGSIMGTQTILEVGENISLTEELKNLTAERRKLSGDIDMANKFTNFISKKIRDREQVSAEKMTQFTNLNAIKGVYQKRIAEIDDRMDQISKILENCSKGYILIDDVIYPGCRVTVSNVTTFIHNESKHCRLVRDGADIRTRAY